jgi:DNA-binding transcriptional ArsR family regulator
MHGKSVTDEGIICADKDGNEILFRSDILSVQWDKNPLRSVAESLRNSPLK